MSIAVMESIKPYEASATDRRGLPAGFHEAPRYMGYQPIDHTLPWAKYFQPTVRPLPARVSNALRSGAVPATQITPVEQIAGQMSRPGYLPLETGYGLGAHGTACVACLTDMPGVRPEMWDWWFGWHIKESSRYKLWHPEAHVFTMPSEQRSDHPALSDKARYIGNVSYIDEYIGANLMRLAVRFVAPSTLGFADEEEHCTTVVGRGGPSLAPVTALWLIHQMRRTDTGSELRSRFYVGPPQPLPGIPLAAGDAPPGTGPPPEPSPIDLLEHCGAEMNHLAGILPALYDEFRAA